MRTVCTIDRERRVALLAGELAAVARELARHCLAADLAVARGDFDVVSGSSEEMRVLSGRWSALYHELLVARVSSR